MKKLLFLLVFIFISFSSFSQIIVHKQVIKGNNLIMVKSTGEIKTDDKVITEEINITEIQDEYIEIKLGKNRHLLSTSKHKNIRISSSSWNKINWNVYDGDKLIYLKREFDILNYFNKYGFEYYKRKFTGKGKKYIILKNNNN